MRKLCIIHFHELEKYPPAINFLRVLAHTAGNTTQIEVITTDSENFSPVEIKGIKINRIGRFSKRMGKLARFFLYLKFNLSCLFLLLRKSPNVILYYETLSAGGPWAFRKFFNRKVQIAIHYHEYTSKQEYETGMLLNRWLHQLEMGLYPNTQWISQTNADRVRLFLQDLNGLTPPTTYILPNYPPVSWKRDIPKTKDAKIRFVYVGALSMNTMYVQEMAEYVIEHAHECYWDIYSSNLSNEVIPYIESLESSSIQFKGAIPYDELPSVISQYDIGLILYKGHIPNYIYNIPNKLFEYHICGLDVWFPSQMKSSLELKTESTYPRILPIDFNRLKSVDLSQATDHSHLSAHQFDFSCERIYRPLAGKLIYGSAI